MRSSNAPGTVAEPAARAAPLRLVGAALVSGMAAGAVAGFGARLVMYAIRLANPAFNGSTTHNGYVNGSWTFWGTLSIVFEGAFAGLSGGVLYVLLRRFLGPTALLRGVSAGLLSLAAFGGVILDGNYEYSRFVSPEVSVAAFAALFPLYGIAVAFMADAIAPPRPMRHHAVRVVGSVMILVAGIAAAWHLAGTLRFRYGF